MLIAQIRYKTGWRYISKDLIPFEDEKKMELIKRVQPWMLQCHYQIGKETLCGNQTWNLGELELCHPVDHIDNCPVCRERYITSPELISYYNSDLVIIPKAIFMRYVIQEEIRNASWPH